MDKRNGRLSEADRQESEKIDYREETELFEVPKTPGDRRQYLEALAQEYYRASHAPPCITYGAAARVLGCSRPTVSTFVKRGYLAIVNLPTLGLQGVTLESLELYMRKRRKKGVHDEISRLREMQSADAASRRSRLKRRRVELREIEKHKES